MASPPDTALLEARLPNAEARECALYERFQKLGVAWTTHKHPPLFTVEEARALRGNLPGAHTKNLFLKDRKDGLWLVVTGEGTHIDLNALARALGAPRFSFGSGELLVAALGVPPGAVTPFALMNDPSLRVSPVLDERMLAAESLNFHPLRNDRTVTMATADVMRFIRSCGHTPRVLPLPETTS